MLPSPGVDSHNDTPTKLERHYSDRTRYLADIAGLSLAFWDKEIATVMHRLGPRFGWRLVVDMALAVARTEVRLEQEHSN